MQVVVSRQLLAVQGVRVCVREALQVLVERSAEHRVGSWHQVLLEHAMVDEDLGEDVERAVPPKQRVVQQ